MDQAGQRMAAVCRQSCHLLLALLTSPLHPAALVRPLYKVRALPGKHRKHHLGIPFRILLLQPVVLHLRDVHPQTPGHPQQLMSGRVSRLQRRSSSNNNNNSHSCTPVLGGAAILSSPRLAAFLRTALLPTPRPLPDAPCGAKGPNCQLCRRRAATRKKRRSPNSCRSNTRKTCKTCKTGKTCICGRCTTRSNNNSINSCSSRTSFNNHS
mmetsp:Transcript_15373/g.24524  ORF Transcript_15373/g.24524 Transcript_15373/m.24524 type:complete len:210 (+) Transcript_15373:107-736(+)